MLIGTKNRFGIYMGCIWIIMYEIVFSQKHCVHLIEIRLLNAKTYHYSNPMQDMLIQYRNLQH